MSQIILKANYIPDIFLFPYFPANNLPHKEKKDKEKWFNLQELTGCGNLFPLKATFLISHLYPIRIFATNRSGSKKYHFLYESSYFQRNHARSHHFSFSQTPLPITGLEIAHIEKLLYKEVILRLNS